MDLIFGVVNLDDKPMDPVKPRLMAGRLESVFPGRTDILIDGPVGFGALHSKLEHENGFTARPLKSRSGGKVLVSTAALDNRNELGGMLGVRSREVRALANAELILRSYEKWGAGCTEHFLGDWSFALWDHGKHRLTLARDHFGNKGLYYFQRGSLLAFSSVITGVLALPEVPRRFNPASIISKNDREGWDTSYDGVYRLPPAHRLIVENGTVRASRYWDPRNAPIIRFGSDREYLEAFEDVYQEAVSCRLDGRGRTGLMLSSGLDSGSIAVLAAGEATKSGGFLRSYTSVPRAVRLSGLPPGRYGDESFLTRQLCDFVGNIEPCFFTAKQYGLLESIRKAQEIFEQLHMASANMVWILEIFERAARDDVRILLSGWGGNCTISYDGDRSALMRRLLLDLKWKTYVDELVAWRRRRETSWIHTIASQAVKPFIPEIYIKKIKNIGKSQPVVKLKGAPVDGAMSRGGFSPAFGRNGLFQFFKTGKYTIESELAAAFGLEIRTPTMDKRVIEFCLGMPNDQFTRNGEQRRLIRRLLMGRAPSDFVNNQRRGLQAADILSRVMDELDEIGAVLTALKANPLARSWINLGFIQDVFMQLSKSPSKMDLGKIYQMLRGISHGLFLMRFEA